MGQEPWTSRECRALGSDHAVVKVPWVSCPTKGI